MSAIQANGKLKRRGLKGVREAGITDGIGSYSNNRGNHEHGGEISLDNEGGLNPLDWKV